MQSSLSSSRSGAMISLAGVALIMPGPFLPLFTQSNPQLSLHVPHSPVYEWQAVTFDSLNLGLAAFLGFLAALP
jgi:hypothetical protein